MKIFLALIHCILAVTLAAIGTAPGSAAAQDIEPRAYSNAPIGYNFLIAGYGYTRGGLAFNDSLPVTNPDLRTSNALLGYARVIELWGQSAKVDAIVPYTALSGTADYRGQQVEREIHGFGNPAFRLSINLVGAPALSPTEFSNWQQDVIIGASLRVSPPWSQYDDTRLVNIGTNRWAFKPEFGVSKALGQWTFEAAGAATFFTDNNDALGGNSLSQRPIYSLQGHLIYAFHSGVWTSLDGTYFTGGRTTLNDSLNYDLQQNWRAGATLAVPLDRTTSVKFYASSGLSARTGNSFDLIGVALQYRWFGGQ